MFELGFGFALRGFVVELLGALLFGLGLGLLLLVEF